MLDKQAFRRVSRDASRHVDAPEGDARVRWEEKPVGRRLVLCDCQSLDGMKPRGVASVRLSGEKSLRGGASVQLSADTDVKGASPRPLCGVSIPLGGVDLRRFSRLSLWIYPEAEGFHNFYFHIGLSGLDGAGKTFDEVHAPSLTPNEWNHLLWEIPHLLRESVQEIRVDAVLLGRPPEALGALSVYIGEISAESVTPDYCHGWRLHERIAYCHSGYLPDAAKIAATQCEGAEIFALLDARTEEVVFHSAIRRETGALGAYGIMDFTAFRREGAYFLRVGETRTPPFAIAKDAYDLPLLKSVNFLYTLRCGCDIPGVHSTCHLSRFTRHPDGRVVPSHGGWHDAGDVSQFEICTAEMAHALTELAGHVSAWDGALAERIAQEARYGLEWLLRTRFGDGYRTLAAHYYVWTDNVLPSGEMRPEDMDTAENAPFENWLAAAAEACAAVYFREKDPVFARWCLRAAREDFSFAQEGRREGRTTRRWGPTPPAQLCGAGCVAAAELYRATGDKAYIEKAREMARTVLACQQAEMPAWDLPLRGFFFEDEAHEKVLTYEHRGHEQSPVQGLAMLLTAAPDDPDAPRWREGVALYAEYIRKTKDLCAPFGMLPGHVYIQGKLNLRSFTIKNGSAEQAEEALVRQMESGVKLHEGVYLRRMPIAISRRGFHATLLSKAKGVSAAARVLQDGELMQVALDQLEWVLGRNPFASSTMYGEGHNYHPLYVAFSPQLTGALPVGIQTLGNADAPYWPVACNAVYKEIWGHTTGKFLWVLSDVLG